MFAKWLTLVPALERIVVRLKDAKKYFLTYLPSCKEYKNTLPKNLRYKRIVNALKDEEKTLAEIEFLLNVAPIFTAFLTRFQAEGPLVFLIHDDMVEMVLKLLGRFLKTDVIDKCKTSKDLVEVNPKDEENQLPLDKVDVGVKTKKHILNISKKDQRNAVLETLKVSYLTMATYLLKKTSFRFTNVKICQVSKS